MLQLRDQFLMRRIVILVSALLCKANTINSRFTSVNKITGNHCKRNTTAEILLHPAYQYTDSDKDKEKSYLGVDYVLREL